uniref:Uncharacterized protein n=1 Tax=Picea glauca TaxID=3330 RepID=A0A101LVY4_PICGL|nr:hypothetical protein ABT39_MTgene1850 [Picea glauca]
MLMPRQLCRRRYGPGFRRRRIRNCNGPGLCRRRIRNCFSPCFHSPLGYLITHHWGSCFHPLGSCFPPGFHLLGNRFITHLWAVVISLPVARRKVRKVGGFI